MSSNSGTDGAWYGQPARDASAQPAETQPEAQSEPKAAPAGSGRDDAPQASAGMQE